MSNLTDLSAKVFVRRPTKKGERLPQEVKDKIAQHVELRKVEKEKIRFQKGKEKANEYIVLLKEKYPDSWKLRIEWKKKFLGVKLSTFYHHGKMKDTFEKHGITPLMISDIFSAGS